MFAFAAQSDQPENAFAADPPRLPDANVKSQAPLRQSMTSKHHVRSHRGRPTTKKKFNHRLFL
jgi:hypothetical protein